MRQDSLKTGALPSRDSRVTMKRLSLLLLVVMVLLIFYYLFWRDSKSVVFSSTSPDGRWCCRITDIDPDPYQVTLVYTIQAVGGAFPLSGTQYISYEDSALPGDVQFEWSQDRLIVRESCKTLIAEFGHWRQSWRMELPSPATKP
jgi:hypothetical protein